MADLFLIPSGIEDYLIDKTYSAAALLIEINPAIRRRSWYRAGFLEILLPVGEDWIQMGNKPIILTWKQLIEIPYQSYRLLFSPSNWLDSPNFVVTPYSIQYNCEERCP